MDIARHSAIRSLRLAMLAAVVLPIVLFVFLAVANYRDTAHVADERLERTVNILQEHALKVFETIERSISETNEIVRGMSDAEIVADEAHLHGRLNRLVRTMPQFKSLWVFGPDGSALVNSLAFPQPPGLNFADRDYFRAHLGWDEQLFVGEVLRPRDPYPGEDFFSVSRARPRPDGRFRGVIQLSIRPSYFEQFFGKLQSAYPGGYAALVREDGAVLARHPAFGPNAARPMTTPVTGPMRASPGGGFLTRVSAADGVERRIAWKKLPDLPVYVIAGTETSAVRAEWLRTIAGYLLFGLPVTALLLGAIWIALERTRRLYQEASRRVAAEDALRQAQRMEAIGQLTGGVAHDFNNILMIVKGNVHRLRRDLSDPKLLRKLEMIDTASQRGETLVRQLLTFSRKQNLTPAVIDLAERVRDIRSLLGPSLRGDIDIRIDVPATIAPVRVDQSELELALLNLAVNARDAMPKGGTIEITVRPVRLRGDAAHDKLAGDFIALSVSDTGCGIPREIVGRIFEPFFTTKDVGKGTGLGLSQVYGFAKQSGGTVTVSSSVGQGTVFTLYLPRSHEAPQRSAPLRIGDDAPVAAGSVLVVEDNTEVADIATALLNELGYQVTRVASAQTALDVLASGERFDLVFSDVVMPGGMNGVELAHRIGKDYPGLPVVLTTGYYNAGDKPLPRGLPVVRKPYDIAELKKAVSAATEAGQPSRPRRVAAG
ncbi:ATP-binding protein [Pseudorhodoplanes sp.]|uniref:hybrid sensor histidine kinase/response regulator n=1 Tax=Pseudorhodoplanes sp. TaxID=1934341 RepID=UPI00391C4CD6